MERGDPHRDTIADPPVATIGPDEVLHGDEIPIVIDRRNVVPPDVRRFVGERHLTARDDRWAARRTLSLFGGWALAVGVGLVADRIAVWILVAVATSVWFSTIFAYVHHSTHGNLFTNRSANHLVGGFAGAVALMPTCAYRAFHATHHAWTRTAADPENLPVSYRNKWHYGVIFLATGLGLSAILWAGAAATLVGRPPSWVRLASHRRHIRRWIVLPFVVIAAGAWALIAHPTAAVFGWLIPTIVANLFAVAFFTLPDHLGSDLDLPILENSRTTVSNRFGRWLYLYDNFHAAHHLVPNVPPCRLGVLDEQVRDRTRLVASGFARTHRETVAGLPWWSSRTS
jgi:fatty acid desaturase